MWLMDSTERYVTVQSTVPRERLGLNDSQLWAKGPQVTMGYLNRPAETAASYVSHGFLRTGDIGAIDEDGFVIISDRIKEMIKVCFIISFRGFVKRC